MANYNKSFNFRNGVQVDTDKFIVNTAGLVGIGSTIPTDYLDVQGGATVTGDIKVTGGDITVTGLVTSSQLNVSGISTVGFLTSNSDAYVSGVVTATRFYGSGLYLDDIVGFTTESWNVVRAEGASVDRTGLTTTSKIGIGTTEANNSYDLIIGSDPLSAEGITFNASTGNIRSSGTITADYFAGDVIAGILTGTIASASHEQPNITSLGDLTTLTVLGNAGIGSLNVTGVSTFIGISTFSNNVFVEATIDTNQLNVSGVSTFAGITTSNDTLFTTQLSASGVSTFNGNVSVADTIFHTGDDNTTIRFPDADNISFETGGTEALRIDENQRVGMGTANPTVDFQLRKEAVGTDATLQVISEKGTAIVAVGDSESLTGHTGQFRYGHTTGSFQYSNETSLDIINYSRGSINNILNPTLQTGIGTGDFNWLVGSAVDPDMTLTYQGKLGIGQTLPDHTLHVGGSSTVTSNAYVGGNLEVDGDLTINGTPSFTSTIEANLKGDILSPNGGTVLFNTGTGDGLSDSYANVSQLNVGIFTATTSVKTGTAEITTLGIGTLPNLTDYPLRINPDPGNRVYVHTSGFVGVKTDQIYDVDVVIPHSDVFIGDKVGIGNSRPLCALDVGIGGTATTRYMRLPLVTTNERDGTGGEVGLVTTTGALIYNTSTNKLQVYTGDSSGWKIVEWAS